MFTIVSCHDTIVFTGCKILYAGQLRGKYDRDDNFTKFVSMLPDYYNRLKEEGYESLGNELLEFAVEQGADSKNVYSLLANAYISMSKADRIAELIEKAKQLNSLSRDGIVSMLTAIFIEQP